MSYLDRVLADGASREQWKTARFPVIGASDAKYLAKRSSIPLYLASKLKRDVFTGNVFTDNGYRWEPIVLGWAGFEHNQALFHAPDELGFGATPDGIRTLGNGRIALAECKVKHVEIDKRCKGPTLPEWRQLAWQFRVLPEAEFTDWCCAEVDKNGDGEDLIDDEPWRLRVHSRHPKIVALQQQIEPIARELHTRLTAAIAFEKEMAL